jgi:protein-L-isoaspartate(D-aspartate) O-methyltransferase
MNLVSDMKTGIKQMLNTIAQEAEYTATYTGKTAFDTRVMQAMQEVDRAEFVPRYYKKHAYDNGPLPIGHGQTISQPYIVALMTDLMDTNSESIVLEIGTGSGYQAAVLSRIVKQVYTIEKVPELAEKAGNIFNRLGYTNIELRCANGYRGWQEKAPFDAIIVTAAASHIPPALVDQLKPGGRLVIPVGLPHMHQELMVVSKDEQGQTHTDSILAVAFVPLIDDDVSSGY